MLDAYSRTARLAPAILAGLPALAVLIAGVTSPWTPLRAGASLAGGAGLVIVALVRDRGRAVQAQLWSTWGGSPSTRRLRWRDGDHPQVVRLHERVEQATGLDLPDAAAEETDPDEADARYEEAVGALRDLTRNQDRFPLVFEENVNYGWRRNSLGLRPLAIAIALLAAGASIAILALGPGSIDARAARWVPALAIAALATLWWVLVVTEQWVRSAAELYSDRLFESAHTLGRDSQAR
ncbi:MAG: hypothetical protein WKF41_05800 [Gaiellaceae bacterium]